MKWLCAGCGAWLLLAGAAGCGGRSEEKPPFDTFPVRGKIVYKDGGSVERLERGKVWFQSVSDPSITAVGAIADDGSFIMTTLTKEKGWPGIPAGKYKIRIEPPMDEDRKPQLHLLHPKHLDYD